MENWKKVIGFEDLYEVSNLGNVRGIERQIKHYKGGFRVQKAVLKSQRIGVDGYMKIGLRKDAVRHTFRVNRLVANAFIDNPNNKPLVNHINGIKTDNRAENLEWVTNSENTTHALSLGLIKTRLKEHEIKEIRESNESTRFLGKKLNISSSVVCKIKNYKAYKHIK